MYDVFHGVCGGSYAKVHTSRMMPHGSPPWATAYQQTQHWLNVGVFEEIVADLRAVLRLTEGRNKEPSAAIFESRTLQSSEDKQHRAEDDGARWRKDGDPNPYSPGWRLFAVCGYAAANSR